MEGTKCVNTIFVCMVIGWQQRHRMRSSSSCVVDFHWNIAWLGCYFFLFWQSNLLEAKFQNIWSQNWYICQKVLHTKSGVIFFALIEKRWSSFWARKLTTSLLMVSIAFGCFIFFCCSNYIGFVLINGRCIVGCKEFVLGSMLRVYFCFGILTTTRKKSNCKWAQQVWTILDTLLYRLWVAKLFLPKQMTCALYFASVPSHLFVMLSLKMARVQITLVVHTSCPTHWGSCTSVKRSSSWQ